jgi:hypothetical protein
MRSLLFWRSISQNAKKKDLKKFESSMEREKEFR